MVEYSKFISHPFLAQQDIRLKPSKFLSSEIVKKELKEDVEINPRDIFGSRLRKDWSYGDTFTSVIRKRIMRRIKTALDPDTYTVKNFKKMRQRAEREEKNIVIMLFMFVFIASTYSVLVLPKMQAIRLNFTLQYFKFSNFIAKELGVESQKFSRKYVEKKIFKEK